MVESICVNLGLAVLLVLMTVAENPHNLVEMPVYQAVLAFGAAVLTVGMFATGYLATSAIARVFVPAKPWQLYPVILAALFSLHLQLMFIAMGGTGWTTGEKLMVRLGGAGVVFVVGVGGNGLLRRLSASQR